MIQLSVSREGSYSLRSGRMSSAKSTTTTPPFTPAETTEPSAPSSFNFTSNLLTAPTKTSESKFSLGAYACGPTASSGNAKRIPPGLKATGMQNDSAKLSSEITSAGRNRINNVGSPVLHNFMLSLMASIATKEEWECWPRHKKSAPQ